MVSGSCACKYISYTLSAPPSRLVNCHCTECRKQSGAAYLSFAHVARDAVTWSVEPTIWKSSDTASRGFCPRCGSTLMMALDKWPQILGIAAGTLNTSDELQVPPPAAHIFLKEQASWSQLPDDGATRFEGWATS